MVRKSIKAMQPRTAAVRAAAAHEARSKKGVKIGGQDVVAVKSLTSSRTAHAAEKRQQKKMLALTKGGGFFAAKQKDEEKQGWSFKNPSTMWI